MHFQYPGEVNLAMRVFCKSLTHEINQLENVKYEEAFDSTRILEMEKQISHRFQTLGDLLNDHTDLKRECILTSFSMNPTIQNFNLVSAFAADFNRSQPNERASDASESTCVPTDCQSTRTAGSSDGLSEAVRQDLIVLLNVPRIKNLSWTSAWPNLEKECVELINTERKRQIVENSSIAANRTLRYLHVNYDELKDLRPHEYPGIESGYEMYVPESDSGESERNGKDEDDTDSAPESKPYKLRAMKRQSAIRRRRIRQSLKLMALSESNGLDAGPADADKAKAKEKKPRKKPQSLKTVENNEELIVKKLKTLQRKNAIKSELMCEASATDSAAVETAAEASAAAESNAMTVSDSQPANSTAAGICVDRANRLTPKRSRPSITEDVLQLVGDMLSESGGLIRASGIDILNEIIGTNPNSPQQFVELVSTGGGPGNPPKTHDTQEAQTPNFSIVAHSEPPLAEITCKEEVKAEPEDRTLDPPDDDTHPQVGPGLADNMGLGYDVNFLESGRNTEPPYREIDAAEATQPIEYDESQLPAMNISEAIKQSIFVVGESIDCEAVVCGDKNESIYQNVSQENHSSSSSSTSLSSSATSLPTSSMYGIVEPPPMRFIETVPHMPAEPTAAPSPKKINPLIAFRKSRVTAVPAPSSAALPPFAAPAPAALHSLNGHALLPNGVHSPSGLNGPPLAPTGLEILTQHCTVNLIRVEDDQSVAHHLECRPVAPQLPPTLAGPPYVPVNFLEISRHPRVVLKRFDGKVFKKCKVVLTTISPNISRLGFIPISSIVSQSTASRTDGEGPDAVDVVEKLKENSNVKDEEDDDTNKLLNENDNIYRNQCRNSNDNNCNNGADKSIKNICEYKRIRVAQKRFHCCDEDIRHAGQYRQNIGNQLSRKHLKLKPTHRDVVKVSEQQHRLPPQPKCISLPALSSSPFRT